MAMRISFFINDRSILTNMEKNDDIFSVCLLKIRQVDETSNVSETFLLIMKIMYTKCTS